jgi:uncharacterized protein YukE
MVEGQAGVSIELPGEVTWFLGAVGILWPAIDEDQVRLLARHVRTFAQNIDTTHEAASSTIGQMSAAYQGSSYERLVATWARMSNEHMHELIDACRTVAAAVDVAADAIVAAKLAALGELAGLAASFIADQAAAVATFGLAEAGEALIIEAAKKLVNGLINQLEQHLLGEVMGRAVEPLEQVVERALGGLVFEGAQSALGAPSSAGGVGASFKVVPDELMGHAQRLRGHADEIAGHAQALAAAVAGVSFVE